MSRRLEYHTRSGLTLGPAQPVGSDAAWVPNTDVFESENHVSYFVVMELAGLDLNKLALTLKGRVLTVRGERPETSRRSQKEFQQMEIDYGPFERRVRLGSAVEGARSTARYSNGFLVIELPKAPEGESRAAKDSVTIPVTSR